MFTDAGGWEVEGRGVKGGLLGGEPVTVNANRFVRPQAAYFQQQPTGQPLLSQDQVSNA